MASSYSSNLKIELMATGENSGTWGTVTNTNLGTAMEQAVIGYGNPDYTSDANLTISITNSNASQAARCLVLNVTSVFGALTATRELIVPTSQKQYIVQNNTTGGQSITVKTSAGTGITVPNGRKAHLYVDGTNVIQMFDFVDINGGAIDGTTIGASSASTGAFTTLASNGATTFTAGTASTTTGTGTLVITGGLGVSGRINATNFDGIIGANTAAAGSFTTLSATGVATFSAGTAALPAITTTGDTNTGIFFSAADTLNFSTGGADKARISSGAYGVFTVGTQSSVGGIGTNYGTLGAWGSSGGGLQIYRGTSAGTPVSTFYADATAVSIIGQEAVPMLFSTGAAEKMRIASNVNGIVTVTPSGYDVAGIGTDYATHGVFGSTGGGYRIYRGSAAGAGIAIFYADGVTGTQLYAVEANQPLNLGTNNATKMTIGAVSGGVGAVGIGYTSLTSVGDNGLAVLGNVGIWIYSWRS